MNTFASRFYYLRNKEKNNRRKIRLILFTERKLISQKNDDFISILRFGNLITYESRKCRVNLASLFAIISVWYLFKRFDMMSIDSFRWLACQVLDYSGKVFFLSKMILNKGNKVYHSITRRCPWCCRYRRRKWTRRHEFKSWTRLIAFHIALMPLGKVWIQLFSLQLWVNSRTD